MSLLFCPGGTCRYSGLENMVRHPYRSTNPTELSKSMLAAPHKDVSHDITLVLPTLHSKVLTVPTPYQTLPAAFPVARGGCHLAYTVNGRPKGLFFRKAVYRIPNGLIRADCWVSRVLQSKGCNILVPT